MAIDHDSESLATSSRCDRPRVDPDNNKKVSCVYGELVVEVVSAYRVL